MVLSGGYTTIYVVDFDHEVEFYTQTLGLKLDYLVTGKWASIDAGDHLALGLHAVPGPVTPGGNIEIGFAVTIPLDDAVTALSARGLHFDGPASEGNGPVRTIHFADPEGNRLYLYEYRKEPLAHP